MYQVLYICCLLFLMLFISFRSWAFTESKIYFSPLFFHFSSKLRKYWHFFYVLYSADSKARPAKLITEKRTPSYKIVAKGYSVDLDCRFKDPYSLDDVTLLKELDTSTQTPRNVDGVKITKSGQIFTINDVQESDKGRYRCKVGSWSYRIESLHVVSRTQPGMKYLLW